MKRIRALFQFFCLVLLVLSLVQLLNPMHVKAASIEKQRIQKLELKEKELSSKEASLKEYEEQLQLREKAVQDKWTEIQKLRQELSQEIQGREQKKEEEVLKLVSIFESVSPKSAAKIIEAQEDAFAVQMLKKMDVKKVAKIMNVMDKDRSAILSQRMADYQGTADRKISSITESGQGKK